MVKLLGIISLILTLVLFPPAALAVVSNNAVPGDATYPIKRGLENVIYAVASLNPVTKAWFAAARSDRRFQEVTALIAQGKKASETLNELVEQTQMAASQIDKVSDPVQKAKLISQLSNSIAKYDANLSQTSASPSVQPAPLVVAPGSTLLPSSAARPQIFPTSQSTVIQNSPTPLPAVSLLPSSTLVSSPNPSGNNDSDIDKARDELKRIKKKLEEGNLEQSFNKNQINQKEQSKEKDKKDNNPQKGKRNN